MAERRPGCHDGLAPFDFDSPFGDRNPQAQAVPKDRLTELYIIDRTDKSQGALPEADGGRTFLTSR